MFTKVEFEKAVYLLNDLPVLNKPAVILCGRSNVGKSTFINSLLNRKSLAKTSSTPGKTRSINYYNIDNRFYLIDLPGYGYAKASKSERQKWARLISGFFEREKFITYAFHIIDSRHTPTELDIQLNELLKSKNIPHIFILNKSDKLKQSQYSGIAGSFKLCFNESVLNENTFFYSSLKSNLKKPVLSILKKLFYQP